jgi:hypothetical protein
LGGAWDFVMHGPDGTDYQEWITWTELARPERIEFLHGEILDDPNAFESVLTFGPDGPDGTATRIEMRTVPPTKELRDEGGWDVPRDRGRPADSEQPGCLRHRDRPDGSGGLLAEKVFYSVSMSLDGFIAPESSEELMGQLWMELQR